MGSNRPAPGHSPSPSFTSEVRALPSRGSMLWGLVVVGLWLDAVMVRHAAALLSGGKKKLVLAMVGLPGRGKTFLSKKLSRYGTSLSCAQPHPPSWCRVLTRTPPPAGT